jgi:hypothetical protein
VCVCVLQLGISEFGVLTPFIVKLVRGFNICRDLGLSIDKSGRTQVWSLESLEKVERDPLGMHQQRRRFCLETKLR